MLHRRMSVLEQYEVSILVTLTLLSLPLLILILLKSYNRELPTRGRSPRSPFKLPIIGNLHQLGSLPHRSLRDLSLKYGPLMLLQLGQIPTLVVSSAEMAKEVLKTQDAVFGTRPPFEVTKQLFNGCKDLIFTPYREHWRQVKKISVVHLLSSRKVQSYRLVREEEVAFMIRKIICSSSASDVVNMSEIMISFANNLICRIASGKCFSEEGKNNIFRELVAEISELLGTFNVGDYFPSLAWVNELTGFNARVEKCLNKWGAILDEVIEEHLSGSADGDGHQDNDFIDILLSLQKDPTMEFLLTRDNIKGIIMDMFAAGTDASHVLLEWAMAELVRNPEVMKKVQDEVRRISNGKPRVEDDDLSQMNYLKAVIKETFRLHPPATLLIAREAMEDTQIKGYQVSRQTRVVINAWAIGRDPALWEAPEEFQPERFLHTCIDFKGVDFQLIPFGAGRRVCPGINFAVSNIELALANLLYRFDWKLPNGMTIEEFDMTEIFGITSRKKLDLHLVAMPLSY